MTGVLVTDGHERAALAAVRSLGRTGYDVFVVAESVPSLAGVSRWARAQAAAPDPLSDPEGFAGAASRLCRRWDVQLCLPVSEASLLAVLSARAEFDGVVIPFPDLETFRRATDKRVVLDVAARLGIAVPRQAVLESRRDAVEARGLDLRFPVVVKPARSVVDSGHGRRKLGVAYATEPTLLVATLRALPPEAYPVLVQEHIEGVGAGVFVLLWNGELLAFFAHRRIREKPPTGGVSVLRESVPVDPALLARSSALLRALDWEGPAMVEYKAETSSGRAYLMEVNPRLWGSVQLAIDAGVDFPRLLVEAALGASPPPVAAYRAGVRSRWFWGDVDWLLARLRGVPATGDPRNGASGRWRPVREFLGGFHPRNRSEIFRWRDPRPFFLETREWLRALSRPRAR